MKNKKALYFLPNFFTTANIASGFYSIVSTYNGHFLLAAWVIIIAVLFDGLDGKIARLTNTQSNFGVEYDSLSDLLSFGIAPSFLIYSFSLYSFGRLGIIAAFMLVLTGALRLARFNVQTSKTLDFVGLPIPGSGIVIASIILFSLSFNINYNVLSTLFLIITFLLSFLMISPIRYRSFKHIKFNERLSISFFAFIILALSLLIFKPSIFIPLIAFAYMISGVAEFFYRHIVNVNILKEDRDGKKDMDI